VYIGIVLLVPNGIKQCSNVELPNQPPHAWAWACIVYQYCPSQQISSMCLCFFFPFPQFRGPSSCEVLLTSPFLNVGFPFLPRQAPRIYVSCHAARFVNWNGVKGGLDFLRWGFEPPLPLPIPFLQAPKSAFAFLRVGKRPFQVWGQPRLCFLPGDKSLEYLGFTSLIPAFNPPLCLYLPFPPIPPHVPPYPSSHHAPKGHGLARISPSKGPPPPPPGTYPHNITYLLDPPPFF